MKKIFLSLCWACLGYVNVHAQENHVILISIDGLRPEFYKDAGWNMVHLRQAMQNGAYSDGVEGVFPTVTYPSHTTMITGVKPLQHGIYYNTPSEPLGVTGRWNWEYEKIQVPTIFSVAKEKGLVTASVFWPVSVGSPATYNLPEYWYLPKSKGESRVVSKAVAEHTNPPGLYEEVENGAVGQLEEIDFNGDYIGMDENLARISGYLVRKYKPAFLAVHLVTVDHFEHEQGRDGEKVRAAIAGVDRGIKTIIEAVDKAGLTSTTTFIITGDHGFVDIHTSLAPNLLLAKAGLYDSKNANGWKAYFHTAGGSAFLHVKHLKDSATIRKQVLQLLNALPNRERKLFVIKDRAELDKIGADKDAILALAPIPGVVFNTKATGDFSRAAKGGTHGYFPDFKEIETGFVAFGNRIQPGAVIPKMGLVDIAPIISELLHLNMPQGDGILYPGLLKK